MTFILGTNSKNNLVGVNEQVIQVVERGLYLSKVDFSVVDGLRTPAEQRQNIIDGVSWSMISYHLPDEDGEANAVDLYPWVGRATNHDYRYYKQIAKAMFKASQEEKVELEWGGFWGKADCPHWQKVS